MVVDFLPVLKHREEVKSTRDAERHPYFYSKTLVNTEKMLESPDFACTLKETKTTIPISRTPKPINEFGLKPGKYRPSALAEDGAVTVKNLDSISQLAQTGATGVTITVAMAGLLALGAGGAYALRRRTVQSAE